MNEARAEHLRRMTADDLDTLGVEVGRLGLTDDGRRSVHRCVGCRRVFMVTPPAGSHFGDGCLGDGCPTYDIARDVDIFWDAAYAAGLIRREPNQP